MKIVIVGGGIGGMALAAALRRVGFSALVLEQAPALGEVGSGLGVLPSAVRALRSIGVADTLFSEAAPLQTMRIANHHGDDLVSLDLASLFQEVGAVGYVMRRTALHDALAACVDPASVRPGAKVRAVEQGAHGADVWVDGDDSPLRADLIVGADGLRSVVRANVLGNNQPRYAGETIFRAISDLTTAPVSRETFGPGRRFGYYDIGKGQTYYWATSPQPQGMVVAPQERQTRLRRCFAGWPFAVAELIEHTPADRILQNDIFDRPAASRWHQGRLVLLGDAAHPTTPNMGQGACMAIEDAVVLARVLVEHRDLEKALCAYEKERVSRARLITVTSRVWGHVGLWSAAPLVRLRDGFFRITPDRVFRRTLLQQYSYDPGQLPT